jgi:hypothetical protein
MTGAGGAMTAIAAQKIATTVKGFFDMITNYELKKLIQDCAPLFEKNKPSREYKDKPGTPPEVAYRRRITRECMRRKREVLYRTGLNSLGKPIGKNAKYRGKNWTMLIGAKKK